MERRDGDAIQWIETVELAPGARESWVCCLEPGEIVAISLSASVPVDAALVDLDAYETWDATDEMPSSPRFANDTCSVEWQAQPSSPLSTVVLASSTPASTLFRSRRSSRHCRQSTKRQRPVAQRIAGRRLRTANRPSRIERRGRGCLYLPLWPDLPLIATSPCPASQWTRAVLIKVLMETARRFEAATSLSRNFAGI